MQQSYGYENHAGALRHACSVIALGCAVMMVLMQGLGLVMIVAMQTVSPNIAASDWYLHLASALPFYGVGIPVFFLIVRTLPNYPAHQKFYMRVDEMMTWAVIALGSMYILNFFSVWLNELIGYLRGSPAPNPVESATSNIPLTILFSVILAPVFEELVFRGMIINRLRPYGDKVCIFFSALLFAMFHGNLYQMFYAFGIGLAFGYVALRTGHIGYTIGLHAFLNLCGGVIFPLLSSSSNEWVAGILGWFIIVLMVSAVTLFAVNFYRFCKLSPGVPVFGRTKIRLALLNPGMAAYLVATLALVAVFLL